MHIHPAVTVSVCCTYFITSGHPSEGCLMFHYRSRIASYVRIKVETIFRPHIHFQGSSSTRRRVFMPCCNMLYYFTKPTYSGPFSCRYNFNGVGQFKLTANINYFIRPFYATPQRRGRLFNRGRDLLPNF